MTVSYTNSEKFSHCCPGLSPNLAAEKPQASDPKLVLENSTGQGLQALKTARVSYFFLDFSLGEQVAQSGQVCRYLNCVWPHDLPHPSSRGVWCMVTGVRHHPLKGYSLDQKHGSVADKYVSSAA